MPRLPRACPMEDGQGIARWVRPIGRRVVGRRSPSLLKKKCGGCLDERPRETVCSWQERWPVRAVVAFCQATRIVCETFLVGEDILSPGISQPGIPSQ